jgi:hypothetical protein
MGVISTGFGVSSEPIDEFQLLDPQGTPGSTVLDGRSAEYIL